MVDQVRKVPSLQEIAQIEYAKCLKSPEYFILKYVYIQMTNGGRGKFDLYVFQKKLLHLLHTRDRLIVLKSRQLGITTLCAAYSLWLMIFRKDSSIVALAPDQEKARNILDKIHFAYDELPNWLLKIAGAESVEKAKLRITLQNGSKAVAASGASKSARGKTATFLILDEAAFIENAEELWGSAQQTLSTGGSAIVLSTPNGVGNLFHSLFTEAEVGENEFVPVRLRWDIHPDRTQEWRDRQDKELGKRMAAQECDCFFNSSGDTFLDTELLEKIDDQVVSPLETRGPTKSYWIWKYPHEVGNCMVIVDTSKGNEQDNSGIQVIAVDSFEQVAELKEDLPPKELAAVALQIALEYNKALIIIENTGIGEATCSYMKDSGYENVFYTPRGESLDLHAYLDKYFEQDKDKMTIGFTNSAKTRPRILDAMRQAIADKTVKINSKRTANELRNFIWKNGKAQAASGKHDDLVIPLAIGCFLRDTAMHYQTQGVEMQRAVLNGIKRNLVNYNYRTGDNFNKNPYEMTNPITGVPEDISWVLS